MRFISKVGYELLKYERIKEEEISKYPNVMGAGTVVKVGDDFNYLVGFNTKRKQWELPMGHIEKGETPREAAARELYEETHQKVEPNLLEFRGLFKKKRPNGEIIYTAAYYVEVDKLEEFVHKDGDENDKIMTWDLKAQIEMDAVDRIMMNTIIG